MLIPGKNDPSEPLVPPLVDLASMRRGRNWRSASPRRFDPVLGRQGARRDMSDNTPEVK
jgi:hypothetical protein